MRIRRVLLEGFGVFDRPYEASFAPGVNAVIGPNESGKSTLLEGILAVLFGIRDKSAEDRFRSRGGAEAFRGELDVEVDDRLYCWQRDFGTHRVRLTVREGSHTDLVYEGEANPRGRTDDLLAYLAAVEPVLGLGDRELVERILFVRQGELETAVDEQVRHLLSGSRQGDYRDVIGRLEDRFFQLTRENPWGRRRPRPRVIEELEELAAGLEERMGRARTRLEQSASVSEEMENAGRRTSELEDELARRDALYENYRRFFELDRDRSELEKRLRVLREEKEKVRALAADCDRVERELTARFGPFREAGPELGDTLRHFQVLQRDVAGLREELGARESELAANPWPRQMRRALVTGGVVALLATGAFLGAGVGIGSPLVGVVLGGLAALGLYLRGKKRERERIQLEGQVVELEERLEKQQAELGRRQAELAPVIGQRRVQEVLEDYRQYTEQVDMLSRYEQIRDSHRSSADVEADYDQVFNQLRLADARARDLIASAPYLANADQDLAQVGSMLERLKSERDALASQLASVRGRHGELKLQLARHEGASGEDAESLSDELEETRERLETLRFRRDALRAAVETLRDCVSQYQESHVEELARRTGEILDRVTGGRWNRVSLDGDFQPVVRGADGSDYVPASLSRGTQDQLYLSLRLAMAGAILGARRPPLILDDALVHTDEERRAAARRLFQDWAGATHQVILIGHDPDLAPGADRVLDLGARATVRSSATAGALSSD